MIKQDITSQITEKLPRTLGLWGIWMLAINGLVGAGIFGLPGGAAALVGDYSVLVYGLCALLILPVVLCFAELGSYFRGTGGPIKYGTLAFGSFVGFQAGWLYYLARLISFSANSVLLSDSIAYFFPSMGLGIGRTLTLAFICILLSIINIMGSVESIRSLTLFTIIKFTILILIPIGGFIVLGSAILPNFSDPTPIGADIGSATLLLIYAFVGFEGAVVPAGEAKRPERDMPWGLLLAIGGVTVLYMLIQMVCDAAVPNLAGTKTPLLDASGQLFGTIGPGILMVGVVTSVFANLISSMFSSSRVTYALALDNSLPTWFGKVHEKYLTPTNSVLFFGVAAFTFSALGSFTVLAAMTVLSRLFLYIMSCAAIPKLRSQFLGPERFILKGGYIIPILGILSCLWLMLQVKWHSVWMTGVLIAVGTGLYFVGRNQKIAPDTKR